MNRALLRCSACRGELEWRPDAASCRACSTSFPVRHGIADFRLTVAPEAKRREWDAAEPLFRGGPDTSFESLLRAAVVQENPDPEIQEVELEYELGWRRRGRRALARLAYLARRM